MLQPNTQTDPLVEILRLAYRRGLAIRQQQAEKSQAVNAQSIEPKPTDSQKDVTHEKQAS